MPSSHSLEVYSPREIAQAAGVLKEQVIAALGGVDRPVPHEDAVRIGRALARHRHVAAAGPKPVLFSIFSSSSRPAQSKGVPLALSTTIHAGIVAAAIFLATLSLTPTAATLEPHEPTRFIFMATP